MDRIRQSKKKLPSFGLSRARSERLFRSFTDPLLHGAGLRPIVCDQYRWFTQELARLFRSLEGRDLAFYVEACLRKWQTMGLDTRTMQLLVTMLVERMSPAPRPAGRGAVEKRRTKRGGAK